MPPDLQFFFFKQKNDFQQTPPIDKSAGDEISRAPPSLAGAISHSQAEQLLAFT